ncbi:MAG: hypothetical protein EBQ64_03405 [Acidimicrobiia bacterium]|nr:hypothetical protein [Acidimicrobiia bacterium]
MKLRDPHHHRSRAAPSHRLANPKSPMLPLLSQYQLHQSQRQLFLRRLLSRLFSRQPSWRQQLS